MVVSGNEEETDVTWTPVQLDYGQRRTVWEPVFGSTPNHNLRSIRYLDEEDRRVRELSQFPDWDVSRLVDAPCCNRSSPETVVEKAEHHPFVRFRYFTVSVDKAWIATGATQPMTSVDGSRASGAPAWQYVVQLGPSSVQTSCASQPETVLTGQRKTVVALCASWDETHEFRLVRRRVPEYSLHIRIVSASMTQENHNIAPKDHPMGSCVIDSIPLVGLCTHGSVASFPVSPGAAAIFADVSSTMPVIRASAASVSSSVQRAVNAPHQNSCLLNRHPQSPSAGLPSRAYV